MTPSTTSTSFRFDALTTARLDRLAELMTEDFQRRAREQPEDAGAQLLVQSAITRTDAVAHAINRALAFYEASRGFGGVPEEKRLSNPSSPAAQAYRPLPTYRALADEGRGAGEDVQAIDDVTTQLERREKMEAPAD